MPVVLPRISLFGSPSRYTQLAMASRICQSRRNSADREHWFFSISYEHAWIKPQHLCTRERYEETILRGLPYSLARRKREYPTMYSMYE